MAVKVILCWATKDRDSIAAIRRRFRLPDYTTLNGWTPGEITEKDLPLFEETARRGFFRFRMVRWTFNGIVYSWQK